MAAINECPECGHDELEFVKWGKIGTFVDYWTDRCKSCGHEFCNRGNQPPVD